MDCSRPHRAMFSPLSNRRRISVQPPSRPESCRDRAAVTPSARHCFSFAAAPWRPQSNLHRANVRPRSLRWGPLAPVVHVRARRGGEVGENPPTLLIL